jgi:hypothetical protein
MHVLLLAALLSGPQTPVPSSTPLEELAACLSGSFSSAAQAAQDTNFFDIRLHMARTWSGRTDGIWLYVEQAMAGREARPYRQRVYRLTRAGDGALESAVYALPDPLRFAGAWSTPDPLAALSPDSLIPRTGCAIRLVRSGPFAFTGSTAGRWCPSDLRGAAYATSEVSITSAGMVTWDRGFDSTGTQVWGATTGGYVFDRISEPDRE